MATTMKNKPAATIDEYIAGFPKDIQKMLELLRATIRKSAPKAEETIKYAIPTFTLNGNLVSFAAWKNHIAFYPAPVRVEGFKKELTPYAGSKSTAKFPLDKPLPLALISKMVKYRVKQFSERAETKKKK
jgi:uncharacterized protein YdhG (YjbR/CyaY superfamily)